MTLEWWQALVLGLLQGVTEFLPVSSSGHLVLVPFVATWPTPGLAFDAAVHGGTAGALLAVFRRELIALARALIGGADPDARLARRLAGLVLVGTAPLVVVGLTVRPVIEAAFVSPPTAATGLLATAVILVGGERWRTRRAARAAPGADAAATTEPGPGRIAVGVDPDDPHGATLGQLGLRTALLVGVGQTLAVLPGVSRSGTTIMTGMVTGLTREAAARFAFLLAVPALAGATLLSGVELLDEGAGTLGWPALAAAVLVAFVSGLAAVTWLLRLVARTSLTGFAVYCIAAGATGWLAVVMLGTG